MRKGHTKRLDGLGVYFCLARVCFVLVPGDNDNNKKKENEQLTLKSTILLLHVNLP